MGYSPWGHEEMDTTEQLTQQQQLRYTCVGTHACIYDPVKLISEHILALPLKDHSVQFS